MSPVLTPDTSEAEDFSTPIAPGTYKARIESCDAGKSGKGNDKIMPTMKVKEGDKTRTRTTHLVISGAGSSGFDEILRACHFDKLADQYKDKNLKTKPPFDTNSLVGQELLVVVEADLYTPAKLPDGTQPPSRPTDKITHYLKA